MVDFQKVRGLARETLGSSQDVVSVNFDLIDAILIPKIKSLQLSSAPKQIFIKKDISESKELGLNFFFNVVNFCFKDPGSEKEYKYHAKNGQEISRSTGLFTALSESDVNWGNFQEVATLGKTKWVEIVQLAKSNPLYLGEERLVRLNRLARYLLKTKNSSPELLLRNASYQADTLAEILVDSDLFEDEFLKRLQVAVHAVDNVLHRRRGTGLKNIEELTCMADYRIPQVFYNPGVVSIDNKLKKKLIANQQIVPDSKEELALRSTVILVGSLIAKRMKIIEVKADLLLWNLSQEMSTKGELPIPHMLIATDKY